MALIRCLILTETGNWIVGNVLHSFSSVSYTHLYLAAYLILFTICLPTVARIIPYQIPLVLVLIYICLLYTSLADGATEQAGVIEELNATIDTVVFLSLYLQIGRASCRERV